MGIKLQSREQPQALGASNRGLIARGGGGLAAWQIHRVSDYIHNHLNTKLPIKILAASVYLSEFHFSRAFRLSFGESPHRYITSRRIEAAKALMSTTRMSLSEIALECGASDQAHFINSFRRHTGETPGSWRQKFPALDSPAHMSNYPECLHVTKSPSRNVRHSRHEGKLDAADV